MLSPITFINLSLRVNFWKTYDITWLPGFMKKKSIFLGLVPPKPTPPWIPCYKRLAVSRGCLLIEILVMVTKKMFWSVFKVIIKPLWKYFNLWVCLSLFESKFHNYLMKQVLWDCLCHLNLSGNHNLAHLFQVTFAVVVAGVFCPVLSDLFLV